MNPAIAAQSEGLARTFADAGPFRHLVVDDFLEASLCRRLLDETRAGLHPDIAAGFTPDMDEFCRVAIAIVRREVHH